MNKIELKSCPFCGSDAHFVEKHGEWGYSSSKIRIGCSRCWARTPEIHTESYSIEKGTYSIRDEAENYLANMWNQRLG